MSDTFNQVVELTLDINRGDSRTFALELTTGVATEVPFELAGSTFELILFDALGAPVLTLTASPESGLVRFPMTLEQKALLNNGKSGRFEFARFIDGNREPIAQGNTNITGTAHG